MWRRQLRKVVEVQENPSTLDGDQSIDEIAGSVWGSTGWYLVVLGQYNLVLFGMKWYWVSIGLLCLYILKKRDSVGCHHSGTTTNEKGKIELLSQWTMEG